MAARGNFVKAGDAGWTPAGPGLRRRVLAHGDALMVVEVDFGPGVIGTMHSHPHVQATYVAEGRFEVTIEGRTEILARGDSFIVPSGAPHGCRALEAGRLIDAFTPMRAEFLEG